MVASASGFSTNLSFEYGTSTTSWTVVPIPGSINGSTQVTDSIMIYGLAPNTFYKCRAKATNQNGISYGNVVQFYTTDCEIPNCDFEIWDTLYMDKPALWNIQGETHRVLSYNGTSAVQIGPEPGAIILATVSGEQPTGGIAFPFRPDSIVMQAKYNIAIGDTAFIIMIFKKNGIASPIYLIPITGNSAGNFARVAYPVVFSDTITPDSLMMGVTSSNVINHGQSNPNSLMTVDDIYFVGTNTILPNWDFEQWDTVSKVQPMGWYSDSYRRWNIEDYLQQTSDFVTGYHALELKSIPGNTNQITVGDTIFWGNHPAFPVAGKHQTLNLYLKYLQQSTDTLALNLTLYKNGNYCGYLNLNIDTPVIDYTPMSFDITYPISGITPDSASLTFQLGSQNSSGYSLAYIDNISFDGFRVPTGISKVIVNNLAFTIYPNPSASKVTVWAEQLKGGKLEVFDFTGKLLYAGQIKSGRNEMEVSQFADGIYLVKISTPNKTATQKLIIAR